MREGGEGEGGRREGGGAESGRDSPGPALCVRLCVCVYGEGALFASEPRCAVGCVCGSSSPLPHLSARGENERCKSYPTLTPSRPRPAPSLRSLVVERPADDGRDLANFAFAATHLAMRLFFHRPVGPATPSHRPS